MTVTAGVAGLIIIFFILLRVFIFSLFDVKILINF
jgi:hypothetical protein